MRTRLLTTALAAALTSGGSLLADTIYKTDGSTIADVSVQREGLTQVTYRADKKEGSVESDDVLFIEFTTKPQLVDRADTAIDEDRLLDAQANLEDFLEGVQEEAPKKFPWSRAYALYRLLEVHEILGQPDKLVAVADRLGHLEPDSRYVPLAAMKRAQALFDAGKAKDALASLEAFDQTIQAKGLGDRWKLEKELATIRFDATLADKLRLERLEDVSARAGVEYPVVRNRAEVAIGETLLAAKKVVEAEEILRDVTEDPKADSRTLAAAYTGLGDCLWARGEPNAKEESGKALLEQASMAYMRVVVVYKNELAYVPKAMFFAGRCFQLVGAEDAEEKAGKLYGRLMRTFPESRWSQEARGFRR